MRKKFSYMIFFSLNLVSFISFAQTQTWKAPADWKLKKNPVPATDASKEAGKKTYLTLCAPCHGEKGKGNGPLAVTLNPSPANHSSNQFQMQKDGEIFYKIITGKNPMPSYRQALTEQQIWNIVNYIRTFEIPKTSVKQKTSQPVTASKIISDTTKRIEKPVVSEEKKETVLENDNKQKSADSLADKIIEKTDADTIKPESIIAVNKDTIPFIPNDTVSSPNTENEKRKFILSGSANFNTITNLYFDSAGFEVGFLPVFLWKPTKRLFFEGHLHISAGGGNAHTNEYSGSSGSGHNHRSSVSPVLFHSTSPAPATAAESNSQSSSAMAMLDYANLVYFINDYAAFTAGIFLSPFGIFSERLHPEWINKLPDAPLGLGHDGQFAPETEFGFQLRGGVAISKIKTNYSIYISNGPSLMDTGVYAGKLSYENLSDNNSNKAIGGRIGILPLKNSSLETGFSFQRARAGSDGTVYLGVDALLWAADISYHNDFSILRGSFDVKAQYITTSADKVYYEANPEMTINVPSEDVNLDDSTYRFENTSRTWFIMAAYRPSMSEKKWLKNFEFVFRYDELKTPCYALWNSDEKRWSAGIIYWLESRSAFKLSYLSGNSKQLVFQFVIGL